MIEPDWLCAFPQLSRINDAAWLATLQAGRQLDIAAGTEIVRKGDPCQDFLLVVEGFLRIYETAENGREILLYRVSGGEICVLTLSNLLEGESYSACVAAEGDVRVVVIPMQHFHHAIAHSTGFRTAILSTLSKRLNTVMELVEQMAFLGLDMRLACLLGQYFGQRHTVRLQVTHQALARELGTTREVVSRMLKVFEHAGCIRLSRGHIELVSRGALARLVPVERVCAFCHRHARQHLCILS